MKWTYSPLFTDKLAKFADEMLLHGEKPLVFEKQFFPCDVIVIEAKLKCSSNAMQTIRRGLLLAQIILNL